MSLHQLFCVEGLWTARAPDGRDRGRGHIGGGGGEGREGLAEKGSWGRRVLLCLDAHGHVGRDGGLGRADQGGGWVRGPSVGGGVNTGLALATPSVTSADPALP